MTETPDAALLAALGRILDHLAQTGAQCLAAHHDRDLATAVALIADLVDVRGCCPSTDDCHVHQAAGDGPCPHGRASAWLDTITRRWMTDQQ
ncbi:hypothetical protein LX15_004788 [Streptoalloteichus tenebrarius]|uniref:Uncharacterized protein n=1 Tax=Streptoalloteichus tenebrarius (strain ATCC 17920 / DSM 40477 / JCM 4838 / CBS 697.72 / NBRC 16177 / NCIMB 11028 / NRRL B-12390 / A12253. 1 / ISP 5477) TaxID=1933 RepID=A0ABT1HZY4_STRSD|nr:hypothetical protein [Streptoalloteichus tenebrarius]MCP2261068.1 hypothetical protein [Streptoalloteichus tenebrarius]BFF03136.1 hypothetical protein GCM10020241_48110 [Streptoalloteichus tenebrarius]